MSEYDIVATKSAVSHDGEIRRIYRNGHRDTIWYWYMIYWVHNKMILKSQELRFAFWITSFISDITNIILYNLAVI